ncbi:Protein O-linked-mannose beta-1,4-N-acetylglucosaminyltransferase 2 [Morella rubra]|uniref:Protein O-linked-mannose beta-1,4-N-acetylglucosaminyltransferase 2 n=1 Tax=Morella rubra TaxID=262757 RepID=A0A6A1WIT2_9ROSI|nr:Protein O-linked-mannose beta-1,4-N-acetylglucosaminyltransferase 2 [Morella rubra]
MMYDDLLAKSFSRREQKRLGYVAFIGCLFIALSLCTVFRPYLGHLPVLNLKLTTAGGFQMLMVRDTSSSPSSPLGPMTLLNEKNTSSTPFPPLWTVADSSHKNTSSSPSPPLGPMTYFSVKNTSSSQETVKEMVAEKIVPVTDKKEPVTKKMEPVVENMKPLCNFEEAKGDSCEIIGDYGVARKPLNRNKNHTVPAVLFSQGGYAGNHFHDFSDVLIPLYLTSRQYDGEVQFLITNKQPWWIVKFWEILKKLTKYELIDIDKEEQIHCFPSATVGLKRNLKELTIDASKYSYSMRDFREFLRTSYSLKKAKAIKLRDGWRKRPSLLIISRGRTRKFANLGEITRMARSLGYRVSVAEATKNVSKFAQMVNSCDVLMGVHGAGLTNIMFLPENAIFIQVIPFGGVDWVATNSFGEPSKDMNLKYLEYTINKEESTLVQQYPLDHVILRDPSAIWKQGWGAFKSVYLDKQDVNIDLNRFRPTLLKALELLHQ